MKLLLLTLLSVTCFAQQVGEIRTRKIAEVFTGKKWEELKGGSGVVTSEPDDYRDPRIDPKAGDELIKNGRTWRVESLSVNRAVIDGVMCCWGGCGNYETGLFATEIEYQDLPFEVLGRSEEIKLEHWRKWAKDAIVLKVAKTTSIIGSPNKPSLVAAPAIPFNAVKE